MARLWAWTRSSREPPLPRWSRGWRRLGAALDEHESRSQLDAITDVVQRPPPPPRQLRVGRLTVPIVRPRRVLLRARTEWTILALPTVRLEIGGSAGGRAIVESLRCSPGSRPARRLPARSVYVVPRDGQPYPGRSNHSRRNAVNRVTSSGIRIACITANQLSADTTLHGLGVCPGAPGCDGLTVVAFDDVDGRGELLAMSHLHIDGSIAELRQAVHAADNPMTDQVRYAVFATVVAELARRDVLLVVVLRDYLWTPKGVRSFQNLLGYQPVNLRVRLSA